MDFTKKKMAVLALNLVVAVASMMAGAMLQNIQVEEAVNEILKVNK